MKGERCKAEGGKGETARDGERDLLHSVRLTKENQRVHLCYGFCMVAQEQAKAMCCQYCESNCLRGV